MAYREGWTLLETVRSATRIGVSYEIRRGGDGRVYCTCPAWRFSKGHVCKHLADRRSRGIAETVADPKDVVQPRRVSAPRATPGAVVAPRRIN